MLALAIVLPSAANITSASASPTSRLFQRWQTVTSGPLGSYGYDYTVAEICLKSAVNCHEVAAQIETNCVGKSDAVCARIELDIIRNLGVLMGRYLNSGYAQLNNDMRRFSRAVINVSSVGLRTLAGRYGRSRVPWAQALANAGNEYAAVTNEVNTISEGSP